MRFTRRRLAGFGVLVIALLLLGGTGPVAGHAPTAAPRAGLPGAGPSAPGPRTLAAAGFAGGILLNISNYGTGATGTYQQMVVLNSSAFADLINSNVSNVLAFYADGGAPIYSWIESGASNASNSTVLWLRLDSIPAESSVQVVLGCLPKSSFALSESGYMGESPTLSPRYAEFDNGWRVFNFYDNFSGTQLNSQLWSVNGAWALDVHDGVHYDSAPGSGSNITSRASYRFPAVVDFYGDLYQTTSLSTYVNEGIGIDGCTGCSAAQGVGWDSGSSTDAGPASWAGYQMNDGWGSSVTSKQTFGVFSSIAVNTTSAAYDYNYSPEAAPNPVYMPPSPEPVGLVYTGFPSGTLTNNETTYWIRERTYVDSTEVLVDPQVILPLAATLAADPGTVQVNSTVTFVTAASGGLPPYHYAYAGLPAGCLGGDVAVLSCAPDRVGSYQPRVVVTDGSGSASAAVVNFTVEAAPPPPPPPPPPKLSVLLYAAPGNLSVNQTLTLISVAEGGVAPYRFAYSGLPTGCVGSNSSFLVCAPTATGTFLPEVNVTDSAGTTVHATSTVQVGAAPIAPLSVGLTAVPSSGAANTSVAIVATVHGGVAPYAFLYANLPADCGTQDTAVLSCDSGIPGSYTVIVTVRDARGATATGQASFTVTKGRPSTIYPATSNAGVPVWEFEAALAGLAIAAALAVVLLVLSRRRAPSRGPEP